MHSAIAICTTDLPFVENMAKNKVHWSCLAVEMGGFGVFFANNDVF